MKAVFDCKNNPVVKFGTKCWYDSNEMKHREDGPAFINTDYKAWWKHGKMHREDGPAIEWAAGDKFYYLEDIYYTEEEYWEKIKELKKCKLFKLKGKKIEWV